MSDVDRLRAAADYLVNLDENDAPASHATAALLRAVADEFFYYNVTVSGIKAAALTLADTILGDSRA